MAYGHPPFGGCGLKLLGGSRSDGKGSHPPFGGCGLKYLDISELEAANLVTPHSGGVD